MFVCKKLYLIALISFWSFIYLAETSTNILTISPVNCLPREVQDILKTVARRDPFVNNLKCLQECKAKAKMVVILLNRVFSKMLVKVNLDLNLKINPQEIQMKYKPQIKHHRIFNQKSKKPFCGCSTTNLEIYGSKNAILTIHRIIDHLLKIKDFDINEATDKILEYPILKTCVVDLKRKSKKSWINKSGADFYQNVKKDLVNKSRKMFKAKSSSQHLQKRAEDRMARGVRETFMLIGRLIGILIVCGIIVPYDIFDLDSEFNEIGVPPIFWIMAFLFFRREQVFN